MRLESVQPARAAGKVVFVKAETAGLRREAVENFLQAEGTRTVSYLGVVLDGFWTHTQLIYPHTNSARQGSPIEFYFSKKKWAPGGELR